MFGRINVHGPGGVGKSALVNWAVYEFYENRHFESIIHLTAKETLLTPIGIQPHGRSLYSLENLLDQILLTFGETPPIELNQKKSLATEILSAWKTLLVLDNMETVKDGRILDFIQNLPPESRTKALLTSRHKTGGWELPFSLSELKQEEVKEFVTIKSSEMNISFPKDDKNIEKIWQATGGLPLAIQWVLGRFKMTNNLPEILSGVIEKDSPVLEFSFRNIWHPLSPDAKSVLAISTIFESPPTSQQIAIAMEFPIERIERALTELMEVTLVTRSTQDSDGRITYIALPITLNFARHQLGSMGDFEINCRKRHQRYTDQMDLQESEVIRFKSRFEKYGLVSNNEKKAAILCQRGESEMFRPDCKKSVYNADTMKIFALHS